MDAWVCLNARPKATSKRCLPMAPCVESWVFLRASQKLWPSAFRAATATLRGWPQREGRRLGSHHHHRREAAPLGSAGSAESLLFVRCCMDTCVSAWLPPVSRGDHEWIDISWIMIIIMLDFSTCLAFLNTERSAPNCFPGGCCNLSLCSPHGETGGYFATDESCFSHQRAICPSICCGVTWVCHDRWDSRVDHSQLWSNACTCNLRVEFWCLLALLQDILHGRADMLERSCEGKVTKCIKVRFSFGSFGKVHHSSILRFLIILVLVSGTLLIWSHKDARRWRFEDFEAIGTRSQHGLNTVHGCPRSQPVG